jgi:hypothetical protein
MMRRLPLLFSVLMIFVLVLAACAPAADDDDQFGPTPDLESPGLTDPGTDPVFDPTPVVEPTLPVETVEPVDPTPEATQPVGAVDMDRDDLNRLSILLDEDAYTAAAANATEITDDMRVGELDSVIVDAQTGEIVYAVIQVHNEFGLDTEYVAIPWSEVEVRNEMASNTNATAADIDDVRVFVNVEQQVLARHPALTSDSLDDNTFAWTNDVFTFWSNEVATLPQTGAAGQMFRIDRVSDFEVENADGDDLGDVVEMVLGPAMSAEGQTAGTGQHIRYVVVGIGGFLGLGQELVAIPFDRLQLRADGDDFNDFVLNIDRDTLEQAPRFDSIDDFPYTWETGWDTDIDTFWRNIGGR